MEQKDIKNIERFTNDEMSAEERQQFENQLATDPELREAVWVYLLETNAQLLKTHKALKQILGERNTEPPRQTFWSENWKPIVAAMVVVDALFLWWLLHR